MVMALKDKKEFYNGQMNYKQGLISGIILSIIIALLSPLTQWITSYVITPEYFPNVIKRSVEIGYFKTTAEAKPISITKTMRYKVPPDFGYGIVTTVIAMIFIQTKKTK
jgi:hypothetical protein